MLNVYELVWRVQNAELHAGEVTQLRALAPLADDGDQVRLVELILQLFQWDRQRDWAEGLKLLIGGLCVFDSISSQWRSYRWCKGAPAPPVAKKEEKKIEFFT